MVGKKVYDEDAIFENFADPAGLIMQQTIKSNVPINYPRAAELYKRAVTLKLPHNPLVSSPCTAGTLEQLPCHVAFPSWWPLAASNI